eukprot:364869-Chlamydomonas_euryale.AAC.17
MHSQSPYRVSEAPHIAPHTPATQIPSGGGADGTAGTSHCDRPVVCAVHAGMASRSASVAR